MASKKILPATDTQTSSPADEKILDVRPISPQSKHATIFTTFDALDEGDYFILVNDHDPVPLKHQFNYEREGEMGWEYLEQGPDVWRVKIERVSS